MIITSFFGPRVNPVTGEAHQHTGVDIAAPLGTTVVSTTPGVVSRVDVDGQERGTINGNAVFIRWGVFLWAYLHLARVLVRVGDQVQPGQPIGLVGSTGRSTGPHLHLQLYVQGRPVDPLPLFPAGSWRHA